jgi:hypothetical protein
MNKIVFSLELQMQGAAVADFQDTVQQCLDQRATPGCFEIALSMEV